MDYITKNEELEQTETYLKNLSNHLKEVYEERGKYFFVGKLSYLTTTEVIVFFLLLGVIIARSVPLVFAVYFLFLTIYFFTGLALYGENILKKAKLPIISKKSFLKQNKSLLINKLNNYNLNFEDVVIDSKNLEFF